MPDISNLIAQAIQRDAVQRRRVIDNRPKVLPPPGGTGNISGVANPGGMSAAPQPAYNFAGARTASDSDGPMTPGMRYDPGTVDPAAMNREMIPQYGQEALAQPRQQQVAQVAPPVEQPSITPVESDLQTLMKQRQAIEAKPIEDDDSKIVNFYKGSRNALQNQARTGEPALDLANTLGNVLGGGLRGMFTKTEDEVRDKQKALKSIDSDIEKANKRTEADLERQLKQAQKGKVEAETVDVQGKTAREAAEKARDNLLKVYNDLPEANETTHPELFNQMKAVGLPADPKTAKTKLTWQVNPDGTAGTFNPDTGEFKKQGNFAKPKNIGMSDIPESRLGVVDEKNIMDSALANVGQLPADRRMKPQLVNALGADYKNEDGSVNEAKVLQDYDPNEVYENLPSNYAQSLAKYRQQLRTKNEVFKTEGDRFKMNVGNYTPIPDARPVSLDNVVHLYRQIMGIDAPEKGQKAPDPKSRPKILQQFYDNLKNYRIQ